MSTNSLKKKKQNYYFFSLPSAFLFPWLEVVKIRYS